MLRLKLQRMKLQKQMLLQLTQKRKLTLRFPPRLRKSGKQLVFSMPTTRRSSKQSRLHSNPNQPLLLTKKRKQMLPLLTNMKLKQSSLLPIRMPKPPRPSSMM
jgi:hypothetical protein